MAAGVGNGGLLIFVYWRGLATEYDSGIMRKQYWRFFRLFHPGTVGIAGFWFAIIPAD